MAKPDYSIKRSQYKQPDPDKVPVVKEKKMKTEKIEVLYKVTWEGLVTLLKQTEKGARRALKNWYTSTEPELP
jgi:hypothetical protein